MTKSAETWLFWAGVAGLATVPLWMDNLYVLHILITTGIFIIAALSLNLCLALQASSRSAMSRFSASAHM